MWLRPQMCHKLWHLLRCRNDSHRVLSPLEHTAIDLALQDAVRSAEVPILPMVVDRILNPEGLRRPDEFVRHKALDAIGDLFVLGAPILGRFEGVLAGHGINNAVVRALVAQPSAWRYRSLVDNLAQAV